MGRREPGSGGWASQFLQNGLHDSGGLAHESKACWAAPMHDNLLRPSTDPALPLPQRAPLVDQHAHRSPGLTANAKRRVGRASAFGGPSATARRRPLAAPRSAGRLPGCMAAAARGGGGRAQAGGRPRAGRRCCFRAAAAAGGWPLGFTCPAGPLLAFPCSRGSGPRIHCFMMPVLTLLATDSPRLPAGTYR